ncbi:hypothetical protein MTR67_051882 [Solanum verrucosum]|nr:hypothetical protein MTR67_051882 [Solanum verrucosum]
MIKLYNS